MYAKWSEGSPIASLSFLSFASILLFQGLHSECLPINKGMSGNFGLGRLADSSDADVSEGGGALVAVSTLIGVDRGVACSTDEGGCPCDCCSIVSICYVICVI